MVGFLARGLTLLTISTVAACNITGGTGCTGEAQSAPIQVEVLDAANGDLLAAAASGLVRRGAFEEEMFRSELPGLVDRYLFADGNGEGTYSIAIDVPGFERWSASGVRLSVNNCGIVDADSGIITAELEALIS